MRRARVVVAGLGDTGVLTAMHLARHADVVGISVKPGLVSGQELGVRLSRPDDWSRDYWTSFERFRRLDRVHIVHGELTGVDLAARVVKVLHDDNSESALEYDTLVISTGVTNGFWRRPTMQSEAEVAAELRCAHDRLADAESVIVVGGGAAAVSSAANLAARWPDKRIDLYFPHARALPRHHPRVWQRVKKRLDDLGVTCHPDHRAVTWAGPAPAGSSGSIADHLTSGTVEWTTGQKPAVADAVLWAIGRVVPNTGWLPADILDEAGYVRVSADLRVRGHQHVFAVGDVAATDEFRTSARNRADKLLARNIRADLEGRRLRDYRGRQALWGSVLGAQADGLEVFAPNGRVFRFPSWSVERVLQPLIVRWGIYGGVRATPPR
ncbi:pyridine nucleotide-disulfide oxidoreductase [Williamsia sp. 1138]|uniref:FAD-dependent oxidoreductase n=1 Tax=Williamsia sp. 1138 TaxID=1903117 RepID=UPI000A1010DF|nr:FAD-dependent oxidoreductase [Williamsia sp. 1138]OZG27189.1 pyridine nucleotide-disulfide oxidoreductase [Williamsia sp. 1138]